MVEAAEGYQKITIDTEKVHAVVGFLVAIAAGPAEAIAILHAAIIMVDAINGTPSTPEELGQALTTGILLQRQSLQ